MTVNVMVVEAEPAELFAQIVYVAVEVTVSGVPQIVPLEAPKLSPDGNEVSRSQVVTSPPVLLGIIVEIVVSLVKVYVFGEYAGIGAFKPTSSHTCPLNDSPEMLAQIVYVALIAVAVGVPVIAQVPDVRLNPAGRAGEIPQVASSTSGDGMNSPVDQVIEP